MINIKIATENESERYEEQNIEKYLPEVEAVIWVCEQRIKFPEWNEY
jgi:hypothetical protein